MGSDMARPRTPTALLDARGAFKHDPQRKRDGEPVVKTPIGAPPDDFSADERKHWRGLVDRAPMGVLTSADYYSVVMAAKLLAEFFGNYADFSHARMARLHSLLGQFGMTPSERAKLSIPKAKEANPFDEFH